MLVRLRLTTENNQIYKNGVERMTKAIINKQTITSLELLEQINFFRRKEGNKKPLHHKTLLNIIRDEFEEEINEQKILPVTYTDKKGEERPMYILTLDQARQVLTRESPTVRKAVFEYIRALENEIDKKNKLLAGLFSDNKSEVVECHKKLIELEKEPLIQEISYKDEVINGLTKDISLMEKRQVLNQIMRKPSTNFHDRWSILYKEFEGKYHVDLKRKVEGYNKKNNTKLRKLDYIDNVMNKLPELYDLACKIFEGDITEILARYQSIINQKSLKN